MLPRRQQGLTESIDEDRFVVESIGEVLESLHTNRPKITLNKFALED